ncbi:MAG: ThuA domain-containing protein [Bryobacteraceae bacterium]
MSGSDTGFAAKGGGPPPVCRQPASLSTADGPLAWISGYKKSRVVVIQLGHSSDSHRHPQFRQLVWNAIEWAAGRGEAEPVRTTAR